MKYYFVGIKGSGMAGLALVYKGLDNDVRGADVTTSLFTEKKLIENNIQIDSLENMNYEDCDIIVVGNAFLDKYDFQDKKVITYQQALSSLNDSFYSIAVCGTHGKTTTTNMIKHILSFFEPINYLVGDGNGHASLKSKYIVYEACEHKDHFLSYHPNVIVCGNVDYDHVEYFTSKKQYKKSFNQFFNQAKDKLILNDSISYKSKKRTSFGLNNNDLKAYNVSFLENGISFSIKHNEKVYDNLFLPFYGKHMLINSLAAISCCVYLGHDVLSTIKCLQSYKEAGRRYNISFVNSNVIIDDYGHHPNEILSTINAIKQEFPNKELIVVYHPDRPKRLIHFKEGYIKAFSKAKKAYILPFINTDEEKEKALNLFIINSKTCLLNDSFYNSNYKNTVFLFTGSKEMKQIIERLIALLN